MPATASPDQAVHTVTRVKRQLTIGCERLVSDAFNGFGHREHARRLTELLFLGAVCSDPFRDVPLLLFVQRELRGSILTISLFLATQVRTEAPVGFRRNVLREALVRRHVEQ